MTSWPGTPNFTVILELQSVVVRNISKDTDEFYDNIILRIMKLCCHHRIFCPQINVVDKLSASYQLYILLY